VIDREVLLKARLREATVAIPDVGEVRVRALSREEVMTLQAIQADAGALASEAFCLVRGMVEPALSEEDARTLLQGSPGAELQPVVDAILALSGLVEGAQKSV